jgi:hypothetical protein
MVDMEVTLHKTTIWYVEENGPATRKVINYYNRKGKLIDTKEEIKEKDTE